MVSLEETGGHPTYVHNVLKAIHNRTPKSDISISLVTSVALDKSFRAGEYPTYYVLPAYPKSAIGNIIYRVRQFVYPMRADIKCIKWLTQHPEIDGVHFQDYYFYGSALFINAYKWTGKWLAYTVHNIRPHRYYPFFHRLLDSMARFTWRRCDILFVHSETLRLELSAFLGEGHPAIYIAPHGAFMSSIQDNNNNLETRLTKKRLLFFGVVRVNKGLHILLEALTVLKGFSLTIAGGGAVEATYWDKTITPLILSLRKNGREVEIIDRYIPEESLRELWDSHSAVILPYADSFQAQSGVLFLAIGQNTPVVISKAGGMSQILKESPVGEVMETNDCDGLVGAINRLYSRDTSDLQNALNSARDKYSWDWHARCVERAYLEVIDRHSTRNMMNSLK